MKCEDCAYWIADEGERDGACRRYPPIPLTLTVVNPLSGKPETGLNYFFPKIRKELWCGEFKVKLVRVN